jgi:hypothetical protein
MEFMKMEIGVKLEEAKDKYIFEPLKKGLLAVGNFAEKKLLNPLVSTSKNFLQSSKVFDGLTDDQKKNLSFKDSLMVYTSAKIGDPLKKLLLGKTYKAGDLDKLGFMGAINKRLNDDLLIPLKEKILGGKQAREDILKVSNRRDEDGNLIDLPMSEYLQHGFKHSIMDPFKKKILGKHFKEGDEEKGLFNSIKTRINMDILEPMKDNILGGKDTRQAMIKQNGGKDFSIFKYMMDAYNDKILHPFKLMLLGKERAGEPLLKTMANSTAAFFNKVIFGFEKAEKSGLWNNLKEAAGKTFKKINNEFFKYTFDVITKRYFPIMKEFLKEGAGFVWDHTKAIWGKIKFEATGLFTKLIGDKMAKFLRNSIVAPLQGIFGKGGNLLIKGFQKGLMLPGQGLEKITDAMKRNRMKNGKVYSAEETERLNSGKSRFDGKCAD